MAREFIIDPEVGTEAVRMHVSKDFESPRVALQIQTFPTTDAVQF